MKAPLIASLFGIVIIGSLLAMQWIEDRKAAARHVELAGIVESMRDVDESDVEPLQAKLIAAGPAAILSIQQSLTQWEEPAFFHRLWPVLKELARQHPGGSPSKGLKLSLVASHDRIRAGEKITLFATLTNVSDSDLNVQVGYSIGGNYFANGWAVRQLEEGDGPEIVRERRPECLAGGWCGTGAGPLVRTLRAHGTIQYACPLAGSPAPDGMSFKVGKSQYNQLALAESDRLVLRMVLAIQFSDRGAWGEVYNEDNSQPRDPAAPDWKGILRSNDVSIRIDHGDE